MIVRAVLLYEYDTDFCMILLYGILYNSMMIWASVGRMIWTFVRTCVLEFCTIVLENSFLKETHSVESC